MFENLIAGSIEPEMLKVLRLAKAALTDVRQKQALVTNSSDHIAALVATQMLVQIDAWSGALDVMIAGLEPKPAAVPHAPFPGNHK